jgi:hypothetical protein
MPIIDLAELTIAEVLDYIHEGSRSGKRSDFEILQTQDGSTVIRLVGSNITYPVDITKTPRENATLIINGGEQV